MLAALEDKEDAKGALVAYAAAARLDPTNSDALCAHVYLAHSLCAWKGWRERLRLLEQTLRGTVLQRQGWGGTCDQPFRLFSYALPADLVPLLTAHVVRKEAAKIEAREILRHAHLQLFKPPHGRRRQVTLAYMSSDFGSHAVNH